MISFNICILLYLLVLLIIFKPNTMNCWSMTVIHMTYRSECMGKLGSGSGFCPFPFSQVLYKEVLISFSLAMSLCLILI